MGRPLLFHGGVVHSLSLTELEVLTSALLVVDRDGRIILFEKDVASNTVKAILEGKQIGSDAFGVPQDLINRVFNAVYGIHDISATFLSPGEFLMPGFVDTHNHAPQWAMRGLGQGLHILDWLDQVTFPSEARFSDPEYARVVYDDCVRGFLRQGITTASYYGSMHGEATRILADTCLRRGQRALVGKCNMDRNAPDYYKDTDAQESLRETHACIEHIRTIDPKYDLLRPVLTPRFAITCTPELLRGLGDIAKANPDLPIQTHFDEAEQETRATKELFPEFAHEAQLYEHFGLLGPRSILAHCTVITDREKDTLKQLRCGVAHCPIANMTVGGGFMAAPVRDFIRRGIKVGLGTDSGGGFSSSMLDSIRQTFIASNAREVTSAGLDKALSLEEGFYLATLGGAAVCGLEDRVGNFAVGKELDALWVRTTGRYRGIMTTVREEDGLRTVFEKFVMTGDDRNISEVFIKGVTVKEVEA
ncbi:Amidohydrolase [Pleurostoma richardsiae]|uniref:Probable guanine deaminase n=1 Tax=Pleurostoma richardsiae TaxID=41990 RepID=A0AA38VF25_9PEZI|nr:Amidohydrolase [Pleurostoma richardsiae]